MSDTKPDALCSRLSQWEGSIHLCSLIPNCPPLAINNWTQICHMMTSSNGNIFCVTGPFDVIMSAIASQITSLTIFVYSTVYSGADQKHHQCSAPLAFVGGIHRWPMNSPHRGPVTREMFPFDDVIMSVLDTRQACNWKDVGSSSTRVELFFASLNIDIFKNISSAVEDGWCCRRIIGISWAYLYK